MPNTADVAIVRAFIPISGKKSSENIFKANIRKVPIMAFKSTQPKIFNIFISFAYIRAFGRLFHAGGILLDKIYTAY